MADEDSRSSQSGLCDAHHQHVVSTRALPLRQPRIPIVTYRTDVKTLIKLVPGPLEIAEPIVKYEFIRMPDSTSFGDYTASGQVIPFLFEGQGGGYIHAMHLNQDAPIAGGRSGVFRRS